MVCILEDSPTILLAPPLLGQKSTSEVFHPSVAMPVGHSRCKLHFSMPDKMNVIPMWQTESSELLGGRLGTEM